MKKVYSVRSIREREKSLIESGISEDELIEKASDLLAEEVEKIQGQRVCIFVGGGNNGSDALSLAMKLKNKKVTVCTVGEKRNEHNSKRLEKAKSEGIKIINFRDADLSRADVVVDGIFGIGLSREVSGEAREAIENINACSAYKIAIDLPSGLDGDGGFALGECVRADLTLTFFGIKQGLLVGEGRNYSGEVRVMEMGYDLPEPTALITEREDVVLPKRKIATHKGTYGNVKIIAGSPTMIGASLLAHESALSALRSGCGYATLCVPNSLISVYQGRIKEELLCIMPDIVGKIAYNEPVLDDIMRNASSIVIGMGLGKNEDLIRIISYLAQNFDKTLVIDGDGLNALASNFDAIKGHKAKLILTPHVGEFRRLVGENTTLTTERVRQFAQEIKGVVAMKSATTIISDGEKIYLNLTGTPAMAKAGSGDVLAGKIGAFSATAEPLIATLRGCYCFGKAGERACKKRGEYSVIASDIISEI